MVTQIVGFARLMRWLAEADPVLAVAPNLLDRTFLASAPNQKWLTDITYLPPEEGRVYLAVVLDLFSRRVIGCAMQATLERQVVWLHFNERCGSAGQTPICCTNASGEYHRHLA